MNDRDDDVAMIEDNEDDLKNPFSTNDKKLRVSSDIGKKQRRLSLEAVPSMENRVAEILKTELVSDGIMQSHKSYRIVTKKVDGTDEVDITRRYSDFEWLLCQLIEKYPCCIIPPLPGKSILTNLNQENEDFIEGRKRGLKYFLDNMFKHQDLRYAPDFVLFVRKNDTEFAALVSKNIQKSSSYIPSIANIIDYIPSVPGYSFLSSLISNISGPEKSKRDLTPLDDDMNHSSKHIDFLEQNVNDLAKYLGQLAQVEKEQANTMIDMNVNFDEIDKLDKENKIKHSTLALNATEKGINIQKNHAKFVHEELELALRDISSFIVSAKEALKRRADLTDAIEKNEMKLYDLKKQNVDSSKISQLAHLNEENKKKLELIDGILPHELKDFEREITEEIETIAKKFIDHQIEYSGKMVDVWTQKANAQ